jgi:hypothetical protein
MDILDIPAVLEKAKSYTCDEDDRYRIALAVKELYPEEVAVCKTFPGYTPELLLEFILDKILAWARTEAPAMFRFMQAERYVNGGMSEELANRFADGELDAVKRGELHSARG